MCRHNTSSSLELGAIFCDSVIHTSVLGGKQQIKKTKKKQNIPVKVVRYKDWIEEEEKQWNERKL